MIVDTGLQHIADQMAEESQAQMSHMAVGTGNVAVQAADTTLNTEAARVALASVTRSDKKVSYVATFGAGVATGALKEVGIFNAATGGTMLMRHVFADINKGANDSLTITVEHTYARG